MADATQTWIQRHERVILGIALLAVVLVVANWYFDKASKDADARLQSANATLQAQKDANDKLAAQNQQAQAQFQALEAQLSQQNQKLTSEMLQLSQTLAARQKTDATLPLPDLANRWEALLALPATSITNAPNGLTISPDGARATVSNLESLPVLQKQLSDETTIADNRAKAVDSSQSLVVDLNKQISGLQVQIVDGQKSCTAQVAAVKKSRWKWFKAGAVVGFIGGLVTGHYL